MSTDSATMLCYTFFPTHMQKKVVWLHEINLLELFTSILYTQVQLTYERFLILPKTHLNIRAAAYLCTATPIGACVHNFIHVTRSDKKGLIAHDRKSNFFTKAT